MAIWFTVDEGNLVRSYGSGVLTDTQIRSFGEQLLAHPDLRPRLKHFADLSAVEHMEVSNHGIQYAVRAVRTHRELHDGSLLALRVPPGLSFGLARMFQLTLSDSVDINVRIFEEDEPALAWLEQGGSLEPESTQAIRVR